MVRFSRIARSIIKAVFESSTKRIFGCHFFSPHAETILLRVRNTVACSFATITADLTMKVPSVREACQLERLTFS